MKFPWHKYIELPTERRNTMQIFVTSACNLSCEGCFARNVMGGGKNYIKKSEYDSVVKDFVHKGGKQINILGGEPFLHPNLIELLDENRSYGIKTTIYTNGYYLDKYSEEDLKDVKLRVSVYCKNGKIKSSAHLPKTDIPLDVCFMVSKTTTLEELLESAKDIEHDYNCNVFNAVRVMDSH